MMSAPPARVPGIEAWTAERGKPAPLGNSPHPNPLPEGEGDYFCVPAGNLQESGTIPAALIPLPDCRPQRVCIG